MNVSWKIRGPRIGLLGNPENRRLRDFSQTVVELGGPAPILLSYLDVLREPAILQALNIDILRIDSPGENEQVASQLIALGGGPSEVKLRFGEIGYLAEYHQGFEQVMRWVSDSGLPCFNRPDEIVSMFDKWSSHQKFRQHHLSRPETYLAPTSYEEFAPSIRDGQGRLFLKPLHGSSASGVVALRWMNGRVQLTAPIESADGRLYNSLKVRTYQGWPEVESILSYLLPHKMIAERWLPKLSLPSGVVDLRILVVKGRARHRVVRQSRHPMTNLHLGNQRGDEQTLRSHLGEERWSQALRLAEQAAACFPNCLYAGVDILLDSQGRAYVGEINAFGDLLPGLIHEEETAYQAIASMIS